MEYSWCQKSEAPAYRSRSVPAPHHSYRRSRMPCRGTPLSDISKPLHHRVFAVVVHYCEPARGGIEPNLVFQIRPVQFEKIVTQKGSGDMITGLPRTSFFIVDLAIMEDSGVNLAVLMIQKAVDRRVLLPT